MKKLLILISILFTFLDIANGQSCGYLFLTNNAEVEMSMFDKKGNSSGKVVYKVLSTSGNEAKVTSKVYSEKGKELSSSEGTYKCDGKNFSIDMKAFLPGEQYKAMKDMEVKSNNASINYPTNMSVGSTLQDNELTMDSYSSGMKIMSMTLKVSDRKVEGKESITTQAGTFECFKITSNQNIKAIFNINIQTVEWFSPNVGIVKTEAYRKGELFSSTLISKISK